MSILSRFREWRFKVDSPGPQIVLEYKTTRYDKKLRTPIVIRNLGDVAAVNIQIESIFFGVGPSFCRSIVLAEFPVIPLLIKGDKVSVLAEISDYGVLQRNDLEKFFEEYAVENPDRCDKKQDRLIIPMRVHYSDIRGNRFKTVYEITHNRYISCAYLKSYQRVYGDAAAETKKS